jgi:hypothetical protein
MREKITLGTALGAVVVAVGGTGLAATTPMVILGLIGSATAGANLALALTGLADCLRQHGQPEMADKLDQAARAVHDELDRLAQLAARQGIAVH